MSTSPKRSDSLSFEQNVSMSFKVAKKKHHHMVFSTREPYLTEISLFFWRDFK